MRSRLMLILCALFGITSLLALFFLSPPHYDQAWTCRTQFQVTQQVNNTRLLAEGTVSIIFSDDQLYLTFDGLARYNNAHYMILRDVTLKLAPSGRGPGYYQITNEKINRYPEDNLSSEVASAIMAGGNNAGDYIVLSHPDPDFITLGKNSVPRYGCRRN